MVHRLLRPVTIINLEAKREGSQILLNATEGFCSPIGKNAFGGLIAVHPFTQKIMGAEIPDVKNHIGDYLRYVCEPLGRR